MRSIGRQWMFLSGIALLTVITTSPRLAGEERNRLRSEVVEELARVEKHFLQSSDNAELRKKYATLLFETGDFWKAREIVRPLIKTSSDDLEVLQLGARLAYLAADYKTSEKIYQRIFDSAKKETKEYGKALEGLALAYYQTREFSKAKRLPAFQGLKSYLEMMKKFPGKPYRIKWGNKEKTSTVSYSIEGMLPTVQLTVNGRPLKFILDTGGDLCYIDKMIGQEIGLEILAAQKATYAYTGGQENEEYLGRAEEVTLAQVTIENVPFILAEWKSRGVQSDGVLSTQALKEFLFTIDYAKSRMIFRERSEEGRKQFEVSVKGNDTVEIPFILDGTHLMFARGSLNNVGGLVFLVDSGLAASMPFIAMDGLLKDLKIETIPIEGTKYSRFSIRSIGLGPLVKNEPAQGLAGVMVGGSSYWGRGFIWDGLISHQFLKNFSSWTIDFDSMKFIFVK